MFTLLKIWYYIKKYWWVLLVFAVTIVLAIAGTAFRRRGRVLLGILEKNKEFQTTEIKVLEQTREKEVEDIKIATEVYNDALAKINSEHTVAREKIIRRRKKIVEKIVNENIKDSNALARDLADEFGFILVEIKDE